MFKKYLDYKRGFETNYLTYFSNITDSGGSPFLNEFVTKKLASCYWDWIGEIIRLDWIGYSINSTNG